MRLLELEPRWYVRSECGDHPVGFSFNCPHCSDSGVRLCVAVHLDGTNFDPEPDNPQLLPPGEHAWTVTGGNDFSNVSVSPSVDASSSGHWHGHITDGAIT